MPAPAIDPLKAAFRGELLQPGDANYDEARKLYNAMIDKRPALIARCVDVADVIAAVKFGARTDMLTAIRGGGHNGARPGQLRRRPGDRPFADERDSREPGGEDRAR